MDDRPIETTTSGVPERFEPLDAVLFRELAEVYLLIDHITSRSDKRLPPAIDMDPDGKFHGQHWLAEFYRITWPPEGSRREIADQAEFLIRTRDALNRIAAPATGATIAFTLMTVGEGLPLGADGEERELAAARPAGGARAPYRFDRSPRTPGQGGGNESRVDAPASPSRRNLLAKQAFPDLKLAAESFGRFNAGLIRLLFGWLILTLVLSSYVAVGNNLVLQLHAARAAFDSTVHSSGSPSGQPVPTATSKTVDITIPSTGSPSGQSVPATASRAAGPSNSEVNNRLFLCNRYMASRENVTDWVEIWTFFAQRPWGYPAPQPCSVRDGDVIASFGPGDVGSALAGAALVNMWGKLLLPACYGFLGALAAVVRRLSAKMKNSELAQRDRMLCWIQLALGAVIGVCVGLFVTPVQDNATAASELPGLLAVARVSTSALSFLAGFGIEHVFLFLEGLLNRTLTLPDATRKTS